MKIRIELSIFGCLLALVVSATGVQAGPIIVGNLDRPPDTTDSPLLIVPYIASFSAPGLTAAQQFTTGSSSVELDKVFASLGNLDTGTNGSFTLTASLYSDDSSDKIPGTVLASFTYNQSTIPTSGFANVEFDTTPINLAASTNYWFVLQANYNNPKVTDDFGSVTWRYTLASGSDVYGPGLLPQTNQTFNNTWNTTDNIPTPNEPFLIQVGGAAAVPEPGSWVLGSVGIGLVVLASRWGRMRRHA
jgi:hypothetical protein